jgi:hypothetical protein
LHTYKIVNIILAGIIGLIFIYSGFFVHSNAAINCTVKSIYGIDCITCGFSRDFHNYINLDYKKSINPYSFNFFLFFLINFFIRSTLILAHKPLLKFENKLIIADSLIQIIWFILIISPIILNMWEIFKK